MPTIKIEKIEPMHIAIPHLIVASAGHLSNPPWFRMSEAGRCPQKQYLKKEGYPEKPPRPDILRKQQIGKALEPWTLSDYAAILGKSLSRQQEAVAAVVTRGSETLYWLGHIDAIVDGTIVDSKVTGNFAINKYRKLLEEGNVLADRTIRAYAAQLALYAVATDCKRVALVFRNREESSRTVAWDDLVIEFELSEIEPILFESLNAYFDRSVALVEPWECRFCGFFDVCPSKKIEQEKPNVAYALLSEYKRANEAFLAQKFAGTVREYEERRAEIDGILARAREALKALPASERKPYHDGFDLSWSRTDRLTITQRGTR